MRTPPRWVRLVLRATGSSALAEDVARFPDPSPRRSPGLLAVMAFRFEQWCRRQRGLRSGLRAVAVALSTITRTVLGIDLPAACTIGPGFVINHFGGIFLEETVQIGRNCSICQGVTIGNRVPGGQSPRLGDGVEVGAYAQILGGVEVGDGARVGAAAVVLCDVPPGATAVGNPARILPCRREGATPSEADPVLVVA